MTDNAKELILSKVNAGNKLAKMYLFLITVGMDINDIVKFMTSPVASFIDTITEENIFDNNSVSIEKAIDFAKGEFLSNGEIKYSYVKKYGMLKMLQIKEAYEELGLNNPETLKDTIADCNEFANVLEGANEFSNFGRLLGLNQGLPTSKIDLQKRLSFIQLILDQRVGKNSSVSQVIKDQVKENTPLDVERWLKDELYRNFISELYDKVKKCINIFDAFNHIEQFDAIRLLLSLAVDIDKYLSFKSKAFNLVFQKAKSDYGYISELFLKKILANIDNVIIDDFIIKLNVSIPVLTNSKYLQSNSGFSETKENGMFYLDNRASIASFKYIFENSIIPKLKQGIITEQDKDGNIIDKKYSDLTTNPFISALIRTTEQKIPLYKVGLNMLTIKDSTESLKKYQIYSSGLNALSKYKVGNNSLSDLFMLYNLIVNKNLYGANRLTTLFDLFISRGNTNSLLFKYFDYLGNTDYFKKPVLDSNDSEDSINISYKDIMISSASNVRSKFGLKDPYIILMSEDGPVIMEKQGDEYQPILGYLKKGVNEDLDSYLERVNNERSYFVLGGLFSDNLENQLNTIQELKDSDNIISYINNFIREGLLTVSKVCE